jgi:PKD repeat protein
MRRGGFCFLLAVFLVISLASAAEVGNQTGIDSGYLENDIISGKLYVNFSKDIAGRFTSNLEGGIDVLDLFSIAAIEGSDYSCDPASCLEDYKISIDTALERKTIFLDEEKNRDVFGFYIEESGPVEEIVDLEFNISMGRGGRGFTPGCFSQVVVDLFNDGTPDFYNTNYVNSSCLGEEYERNYGCFEADEAEDHILLTDEYYCQPIKDIPPAAAYTIGTNVELVEGSEGNIAFYLFYPHPTEPGDLEGKRSQKIEDPVTGNINGTIEYHSLEPFDGMICIFNAGGNGKYRIRLDQDGSEQCGLKGENEKELTEVNADYELYIRPLMFAPLSETKFDKAIFEEVRTDIKNPGNAPLKDYLNEYLSDVYDNDCKSGCVIPFAIWGEEDREAELHEAELTYEIGVGKTDTKDFYELARTPAKISSDGFLEFDFEDMGFEVPNEDGEHEFFLCLNEPEECDDDNSIFEDVFSVSVGFDFDMGPRFALVKQSTEFEVVTSSEIESVEWDFDDGSTPIETTDKFAYHSFDEAGDYIFTITVTDVDGSVSTKKFKIIVGDAKSSVNVTLNDYERRIKNLEGGIISLPEFAKSRAEGLIDTNLLERKVKTERENYERLLGSSNTADEDYIEILNSLLTMDVPRNVFVTSVGTPPVQVGYGSGFSGIDLNILKEATGYSNDVEQYEAASKVVTWMESNYAITLGFTSVSVGRDTGTSELFKVYDIVLGQKEGADQGTQYFVIDQPLSSIEFDTITTAESASGGTFIEFEGSLSRVKFSIDGPAPGVEELGIYVSPSLSNFEFVPEVRQSWYRNEKGEIIWWRLILGLSILFVVFLIVYIILQTWYKNNYEKKLFKNPDDLYNLINFIYNSRKSGLYDDEIRDKLKEKKWKGEQITYAFKKIDGKRTGMWEIPLFKFAENKKVKKEIEKRQGAPVDTRFIKRPRFRVR